MNPTENRRLGRITRHWRLFLLFCGVAFAALLIGDLVDATFHTTIGWYFAMPCVTACSVIVQSRRK